jgi:8-oxo-dGTP pyrophosphatase MutT (NUDIX family)
MMLRPALPAATVVLVRDAAHGVEVLMLQRNLSSGFMPGMFLFPGGALDPIDQTTEVLSRCCGLTEDSACTTLSLESGGLAYWAAAIRESFEEAGVLLAYDAQGTLVNPGAPAHASRYDVYRRRLNAGEQNFGEMLVHEGLSLATDRLTYFSHWITPVSAPRRYDTRFFAALAPPGQEALPDQVEAIHHVWVDPRRALERYRAGEYKMRTPTLRTLERLSPYERAETMIEALRAEPVGPAILPRIGPNGERLLPGDPGYDELAATEAQGKWTR